MTKPWICLNFHHFLSGGLVLRWQEWNVAAFQTQLEMLLLNYTPITQKNKPLRWTWMWSCWSFSWSAESHQVSTSHFPQNVSNNTSDWVQNITCIFIYTLIYGVSQQPVSARLSAQLSPVCSALTCLLSTHLSAQRSPVCSVLTCLLSAHLSAQRSPVCSALTCLICAAVWPWWSLDPDDLWPLCANTDLHWLKDTQQFIQVKKQL